MISANVRETRLKEPVTVVPQKRFDGDGTQLDLVCAYGRLEAFVALGETTIPAVIVETSPQELVQHAHAESSCERTTH